jgi:hypothetical protein
MVFHKFRGKVWIKNIICKLWILLIGLEEGSESGVTCCSVLNNLLHSLWTVLIPSDILLARKVDLKSDNIGRSTMHGEMEEAPNALARRNVASIEVLFDFIIASAKLHCDVIMAFVDILENVLDSLD